MCSGVFLETAVSVCFHKARIGFLPFGGGLQPKQRYITDIKHYSQFKPIGDGLLGNF